MEHVKILETASVSIDAVTRHPENARRADSARVEKSLRAHGQYAPIIVHEGTDYILKGNNTHRILKDKIGATSVLVTYVRCTEKQARAILAVDNHTTDAAGYDDVALLALLEQVDADGMLAASGYSQQEVNDLAVQLADVEEEEPDLVPETPNPIDAAPRVEKSDEAAKRPRISDLAKGYNERSTRMISLTYELNQYSWMTDKLDTLGRRQGITNSADVILWLIHQVTGESPPEAASE